MGRQPDDTYVTRSEAAQMLEVTTRAITMWVRDGRLKQHSFPKTRAAYFLREDVQRLMVARSEKGMDLWKVHNLALSALGTAQRTERRLLTLLDQLGFDAEPLQLDEESVQALHVEANRKPTYGEAKDESNLRFWSGVFFSIDDPYLEIVRRVTGDEEPWRVFIDFANALTASLREGGVPPSLADLVPRFEFSKKNLLHVSYLFCRRVHGKKVADIVFDGKASAVSELMAILH